MRIDSKSLSNPNGKKTGEMPRGKRLRRTMLRLLVSLGCIAIIYGRADLDKLGAALRSVPLLSAVTLVCLYIAGQMLSAVKWRIFIAESGLNRNMGETIRAYWLGMFFNNFGLGTVSGDVARAIALRPKRGERAAALATVVADRLLGLVILVLVGAVSTLVFRPEHLFPIALPISVGILIALGGIYWYGPVILTKIFPEGHRFGAAAVLAAGAFPKNHRPFLAASTISAIFHLSQIWIHWLIAQDLGLPLSFGFLCATVPIVNIACSVPISINGLGVREAMYVLLFAPAGIAPESAIAIGAIWIVIVTVVSAFGGFTADRVIVAADEEQADAEPEQQIENKTTWQAKAAG